MGNEISQSNIRHLVNDFLKKANQGELDDDKIEIKDRPTEGVKVECLDNDSERSTIISKQDGFTVYEGKCREGRSSSADLVTREIIYSDAPGLGLSRFGIEYIGNQSGDSLFDPPMPVGLGNKNIFESRLKYYFNTRGREIEIVEGSDYFGMGTIRDSLSKVSDGDQIIIDGAIFSLEWSEGQKFILKFVTYKSDAKLDSGNPKESASLAKREFDNIEIGYDGESWYPVEGDNYDGARQIRSSKRLAPILNNVDRHMPQLLRSAIAYVGVPA